MRLRGTICLLALLFSWPARAVERVDAKIAINQVISKKLLPIDAAREGFVTPAFKFFQDGKLVGLLSGAPPAGMAFPSAMHSVPKGFSGKGLNEELAALHVPASTEGQTVVAYVMGGYCPPCGQIVGNVKAQLAGAARSKARVIVV